MSRTHHVTHSYTAERLEKIRKLITALMVRKLARDEIGTLLQVGPSCVRKYLADLRGKVLLTYSAGVMVCRLAVSVEEARAYLASISAKAPARTGPQPRSAIGIALADPSRHIHIMRDDEAFMPKMIRNLPSHEPMMAHFYGLTKSEARA